MTGLTRREWALALLSLAASTRPALPQAPSDQGIGGTGAAPRPPTSGDRGIGGTGVIGTIRRFGSIYVNGLRIAYPPEAEVLIDGRRASAAEMKIGHVAQAVAAGPEGALVTRRIEIASEVIGPIERVTPQSIVVLGQVVDLRGISPRGGLKPGSFVAVSGQRRPNGIIVASLVEPRPAGRTALAGPVDVDAAGRPSIGGLALRGLPPGLAGARVRLEGAMQGDTYSVSRFRDVTRPFGPEVRRVSIEGYVGQNGRLGSGLAVTDARGATGLVTVTGRVSPSGGLIADTLRAAPGLQLPELGGPAPLRPPIGAAPGLRGGAPTDLVPSQPGGLAPSLPGLGAPGGGLAPNIGVPGVLPGGLPGLRR